MGWGREMSVLGGCVKLQERRMIDGSVLTVTPLPGRKGGKRRETTMARSLYSKQHKKRESDGVSCGHRPKMAGVNPSQPPRKQRGD